jgi:DNA-binding transcriptional LysR family regulator
MELDSLASVASMVSHGLGVAILPIPIAANEISEKLKFIPIDRSKFKREIGILYKKNSKKYSLIEIFAKSFNTVVTT